MKSQSLFNHSVTRQLCWLALAVFGQAAVPDVRASNPAINGPSNVSITDAQATNLFAVVTVQAGSGGRRGDPLAEGNSGCRFWVK